MPWEDTELGPVGSWPLSLCTAVTICLDSAAPMCVWAGPELLLICNERCSQILGPGGYKEVIGRPARQVFGRMWDVVGPQFEQVRSGGPPVYEEEKKLTLRRRLRTAEDAFFSYSLTPIRDEQGRVTGVLTPFTETTSRRLAEEALRIREQHKTELLQRMLDNIPVMLVVWDPNLQRFTLNRHAENVLGWTTAEANDGQDFMEKVYPDPEYRAEVASYMQSLAPGWRDWTVTTKGNEEIPSSWANVGLSDNTMVGIGIDLREQKSSEEALRCANENLRRADRHKDEFLGMLSHELRNPLAAIKNSLYILYLDAEEEGEPAHPAVEIINRQVGQLVRLVDDLLDVTRITRGKLRLQREKVDLGKLVRDTVEDHRSIFEQKQVRLTFEPTEQRVLIDADPNRIAQVIGNLLHNAAKFTPKGGRTSLGLELEEEHRRVVLSVKDTGVGMTRETLDELFEPFVQAESSLDSSNGGLGLGLALVKGLVDLHGGQITAHSAGLDKGAHFVVSLPLDAPSE